MLDDRARLKDRQIDASDISHFAWPLSVRMAGDDPPSALDFSVPQDLLMDFVGSIGDDEVFSGLYLPVVSSDQFPQLLPRQSVLRGCFE